MNIMENCVVKELVGNINSNDFPIFDTILLMIRDMTGDSTANNHRLALNAMSANTVKLELDGDPTKVYFTDSTLNDNLGQTIYAPTSNNIYIINKSGADAKLFVRNKTKISKMFNYIIDTALNYTTSKINVSELKYCTGLVYLAGNYSLEGELAELKELPITTILFDAGSGAPALKVTTDDLSDFSSLTNLQIFSGIISGDIKKLGKNTAFTAIRLRYSSDSIFGTLEELCENMIENGRSSGNLEVCLSGTQVTFNGSSVGTSTYNIAFANGGCAVSRGGNQIASYNGTSWTYA